MISDDSAAVRSLSWTRPPAVVRRCVFVCFGGAALGHRGHFTALVTLSTFS